MRPINQKATNAAREKQLKGIARLNEAFGWGIVKSPKGKILRPPPKALEVLLMVTHRQQHPSPKHGPRGIEAASKKRRLRRRSAALQRVSWCHFHEENKRLDAQHG